MSDNLSAPANPGKATDQEVVEALEKSSRAIVVVVKEIHENKGLGNLDPKLGRELKQLMKDANEIHQHVMEAEKHNHIDHSLVKGCMRDEEEMEKIAEDLEKEGSMHAMALEGRLKTLIKYTRELGRRLS